MRKMPIKFTFNNKKYTAPINKYVPAEGYVSVLTKYPATLSTDPKLGDAIKIYVECNRLSGEEGRIYALFYNLQTLQFDSNFTVN